MRKIIKNNFLYIHKILFMGYYFIDFSKAKIDF
jgi:hypothetical protein